MGTHFITVLYRVCYVLIHGVFTLFELINDCYTKLGLKFIELYHEFSPVNKKLQKIQKIPQHVTILLGNEEPSLKDLANLILWCMAAHVTFISFYDYKGILKKNEDRLHQLVAEKKGASDHVIWHHNPDCVHKNGYTGRKIHVKVLSNFDGRESVTNLTKQFAFSGANTDFINLNNFEKGLKKSFEFPDPDLGVCCGKSFSLYGYPPWQIRVTEFLTIPSHHNITFDNFVKLLFKFNKCEQRFGK